MYQHSAYLRLWPYDNDNVIKVHMWINEWTLLSVVHYYYPVVLKTCLTVVTLRILFNVCTDLWSYDDCDLDEDPENVKLHRLCGLTDLTVVKIIGKLQIADQKRDVGVIVLQGWKVLAVY